MKTKIIITTFIFIAIFAYYIVPEKTKSNNLADLTNKKLICNGEYVRIYHFVGKEDFNEYTYVSTRWKHKKKGSYWIPEKSGLIFMDIKNFGSKNLDRESLKMTTKGCHEEFNFLPGKKNPYERDRCYAYCELSTKSLDELLEYSYKENRQIVKKKLEWEEKEKEKDEQEWKKKEDKFKL